MVGRRRRATYAKISIAKKQTKSSCVVSHNIAQNLRLRQDDKLKVVPLNSVDESESRSGDLILMQSSTVPSVSSVTFSPIQDSLETLQAGEGGDEIADEEIMERFVQPYAEGGGGLVKSDTVLTLSDENGKKLDFIVTQVDVDGGADDKEESEEAAGTYIFHEKPKW